MRSIWYSTLQDALLVTNTTVQVARAANLIYAILQYRREVDREELNPVSEPQNSQKWGII